MEEFRYNRTFKNAIIAIVFGTLLFGSVVAYAVIAKIQYDSLVSGMRSVEATIVDIDLDIRVRAPDVQEIFITYEVGGVTYSRELETDTSISFLPGRGAHFSVGDKIDIFYDPQNPEVIASPRSVGVGYFYMAIGLFGLALTSYSLFYMVKHSRKFLVTQEEYEREGEELKKSKAAEKERKQKMKLERKKKYAKRRKVIKIILIVLAVPVGAFILFLLFGALLMAFGY